MSMNFKNITNAYNEAADQPQLKPLTARAKNV